NITLIEKQKIIAAFDTGPANCLLDAWMREIQNKAYDKDGEFAHSGQVIPELLKILLKEPYFHKAAPKSTGRELFNLHWLKPHLKKNYKDQDVAATLTELTATTVAQTLVQHHFEPQELILCGG